jgi:hypothetical protein
MPLLKLLSDGVIEVLLLSLSDRGRYDYEMVAFPRLHTLAVAATPRTLPEFLLHALPWGLPTLTRALETSTRQLYGISIPFLTRFGHQLLYLALLTSEYNLPSIFSLCPSLEHLIVSVGEN